MFAVAIFNLRGAKENLHPLHSLSAVNLCLAYKK